MNMATGFTFGQTPKTSAGGLGGFSFGQTPATTATTGFSLGGAGPVSTFGTPTTSTAAIGGFSFGGTTTSSATTGFTLGGAPKTTAASGLVLGAATPSASLNLGGTTGFSLGGTTTTASTGLTLGGATSTGFKAPTLGAPTFGAPTTTIGLTLGTLGTTTGTAGGVLGGLGAAAGGMIFGAVTTKASTVGLGGVDPKTSTAVPGSTNNNGKPSDSKALKEINLPELITATVEAFKKHVKEEKCVREDIARMSSKPMYKVHEEVAALKQLLSVISNGLQRNAAAVEKLKRETAQEMKNAEMAQRTKDIPPGLQYENTAPAEYFKNLVEQFEIRKQMYRHQIETMEGHLASIHQPNRLTPADLILLLRKLHESFIALAAKLHEVHESVKNIKEQYLNYRKVFHGDTKNVFEKQKVPAIKPSPKLISDQLGPSPFTVISTATAMMSAINRTQQHAGAPPAVGLNTIGGLGSTPAFGGNTGLFGGASSAAGTSSTGLFSTPLAKANPVGGFTTQQAALNLATTPTAPIIGTATPQVAGDKPFQLGRPPLGSKRGKR